MGFNLLDLKRFRDELIIFHFSLKKSSGRVNSHPDKMDSYRKEEEILKV